MSFLALIIALSLHQLIRPGSAVQRDSWLLQWEQRLSTAFGQSALALVLTVAVPLLVLVWLLSTVDSWLFGLVELLGVAALLLWSLGREDYHTALECCVARQAGHVHGNQVAERLWAPPSDDEDGRDGFDDSSVETEETAESVVASADDGRGDEDSAADEADWEREQEVLTLVYGGYARWFAPVFYFVLFGVVGAVLYRGVAILARSERDSRYLTILAALDWIPSRLLCLTFALTGDFLAVTQSRVVSGWLSTTSAAELLATAAGVACASPGSARAVGDILYRSSGFWLLIVSAIALLG